MAICTTPEIRLFMLLNFSLPQVLSLKDTAGNKDSLYVYVSLSIMTMFVYIASVYSCQPKYKLQNELVYVSVGLLEKFIQSSVNMSR